ncbi:hypothetical protein B9Z55_014245 [Caenorhabditis nigoni]|uniref:Condensin complex subunit 2 n=1 Tax=Caenorhabditis nigoni TaxID=1611254 RepID=A0A2G5U589_9PELO|nr:hypothetical protein B9Z55_014245 [Caenorhabditis nigoni]
MDASTSNNVTGRRKRNAAVEGAANDDSFEGATPMRKVRGNKKISEDDVVSNDVMKNVNSCIEVVKKKKGLGMTNCYDYKSPLELYGIEQMIEAKASIQDMAVVLDTAQQILGHRVDRLHQDVRGLDQTLSSGDLARGDGNDETVHLTVESRRAKKKMAVTDGVTGMNAYLKHLGDEEAMNIIEGEPQQNEEEEPPLGGEAVVDVKANSKDVDLFLENEDVDEVINALVTNRTAEFRGLIGEKHSTFVTSDETAYDIKDASIDWLRTNPEFQKATKGSLDNNTNSFHSLNYYGMHSENGRTLFLHSRVADPNKSDRYFTGDVSVELAKNTRVLLENSLEKKPHILDNYLMLEIKERPVIGTYKDMNKDSKKVLPLAEGSHDRDLTNMTYSDANNRAANLNATVVGASDMSMLPGHQGLPLASGEDNGSIDPANQTLSAVNPLTSSNDDYVPPTMKQLELEESLIGKLPHDAMEMDKLVQIFEEKIESAKSSDAVDSKVWKNGLRAEEWGDDDEAVMKSDTRSAVQSGMDGWIKATDAWTNYDVVKMIVNRDARMQLDETAIDEQDSHRNLAPDIGKSYFLVRSEEYTNGYPADRTADKEQPGDKADVMKMWSGEEDIDDIPLEQIQKKIREQDKDVDDDLEPIEDADFDAGGVDFNADFDAGLAHADFDDIAAPVIKTAASDDVADIIFNDQMEEVEAEVRNEHDIQKGFERIALGNDEVAELMTSAPPEQLVGPTAEMRDEIRNIGRNDNAHWTAPEIADQEKFNAVAAQRKRREKKSKSRKATVEDFVHYFRDIPIDELEREMTAAKCIKIADEKSTFLTEQQLYLPTLGLENKPHVAFEMGLLGNNGLFYKKSYGKIKLERIKQYKNEQDIYIDETKGNKDSDCLNWLATFSGFKCMENPEAVSEDSFGGDNEAQVVQPYDNDVDDLFEYDRYDPRHDQELAAAQMGPEMQKKFALTTNQISKMMFLRDILNEREDDDTVDEFDDSFDRQTIQAKNLDAAKHKKCLAEILKSDKLSMPSIQYALEQLSVGNNGRLNNTTVVPAEPTIRETPSPERSFEADKTLISVFEYHSPTTSNHNIGEIMKALTEVPDYKEEEEEEVVPDKPTTSEYGTANTENRQVKIRGCHTLLSLALSMPSKMGENVRPSSIVSFLLHIANENGLNIIQDRSKRSWMSDFIVLNRSQALPRGLKMGNMDEQGEFWKRTQDPDAIEGGGGGTEVNSVFGDLANRPKAVPTRRGRGVQRGPSPGLGAINEDDEMEG